MFGGDICSVRKRLLQLIPEAVALCAKLSQLEMLLKQGRRAEARAALARYLQLSPNAPDAALVRQMMAG